MKKLLYVVVALILCAASFFIGRGCQSVSVIPSSESVVVDSTTSETIIPDLAPALRDSVVVRYQYEIIPVSPPPKSTDSTFSVTLPPPDSLAVVERGDSAEVIIPITQKVYETEDYRAYISGYRATMDSIFIRQRTNTIRIREPTKPKHFSIGLQVGYGMTPKGFQPYAGVGVTVNLWSF